MLSFSALGMERLQRLGRFRMAAATAVWADEIEPVVRAAIQRAAPVGKGAGAGRLRDSIRSDRRVTAGGVTLRFTANVPYAGYVVRGTRPHVIAPRNGRALYWVDSGGSHFARLVHHPGTKPNPFAVRAVKPLAPMIASRLVETVGKTFMEG